MALNIFKPKRKRGEPDDDLQVAIAGIEKFAPRMYLQEREMYYYNYRQINKYLGPLRDLLIYISGRPKKEAHENLFVQGHFKMLKHFYDVNDKLSLKEATLDNSLIIRLLQLFKMFYGEGSFTKTEIEAYLKNIRET